MLNVAVLVLGAIAGFVGSRRLRRPEHAAQAASMARNVGGSLGRRRGLSAPELQRACFSEMVRHVRVSRHGHTYAPARYALHLHPDDLAVVDEASRWFTEGLADALRQAALDNGWELDGTVQIEVRRDPSRRPGVPSALAMAAAGLGVVDHSQDPAVGPRAATAPGPVPGELGLIRADTGERIPLAGAVVTIGRSRDRVINIDDTRVSRAHARIEPHGTGWAIVDEGSANGTRVGHAELPANHPRPLRVGDVIGIGPAELRVEAVASPGATAGTRALDDSDRNRISGEVLPPSRGPQP